MLQFIANIVEELPVGENANRIAAVLFGGAGQLEFDFDDSFNKQTIQQLILDLDFLDQSTNTSGGLYVVLSQLLGNNGGNRPEVNDYVVIITDGVSTVDPELTIPYAEEIQNTGAKVLSIGITGLIDEDEIRAMSSLPRLINQTYFLSPDFSQASLQPIVAQILDATCSTECEFALSLIQVNRK